jgi:hypothetical protein
MIRRLVRDASRWADETARNPKAMEDCVSNVRASAAMNMAVRQVERENCMFSRNY